MPGGFAWEAVEVYSGYVQPPHPWLVKTPKAFTSCNFTSQGLHVMCLFYHTTPQQHMQADKVGFTLALCNLSLLIAPTARD